MPLCRNSNSAAALTLLALSLWTSPAVAQTSAVVSAQPGSPAVAADAALPYRSALEGYRAHTDEKVGNWKDANATVARIGGWRAYAKEGSEKQVPEDAARRDAGAPPAKP